MSYKVTSRSQYVHNILFNDDMMSPKSFMIVSDTTMADYLCKVLNSVDDLQTLPTPAPAIQEPGNYKCLCHIPSRICYWDEGRVCGPEPCFPIRRE